MKDYYAALGLSRSATEREIKQAFRRLARKYHPDVNPDDRRAESQFKVIREAYEVLSDPLRRRDYDSGGLRRAASQARTSYDDYARRRASTRTRPRPASNGAASSSDGFSDFVRNIFRGESSGSRSARGVRGVDRDIPVQVTLEEAFTGTWRRVESPVAPGKQIEVRIPAGVQDGQRVRVAGAGSPGALGGPRGDLYLTVRLRPHEQFERRGNNLQLQVLIPLGVAFLGGEIAVPTLRGKTIQLRIPAETQNGTVFRLRGQGMPDVQGGATGDLLAEVKVLLPTNLSPRQQALIAELFGSS